MKFKKTLTAVIMVMIIAVITFIVSTSTARNSGTGWNGVEYYNGLPTVSINMINLDSATNTTTGYDKVISQFHAKSITMASIYKAPAGDSGRIVILGRTGDFVYPVDTQFVYGAASYTYVTTPVTLSLSGYGGQYAIRYENTSQVTANGADDTLLLQFTPSEVNYVPNNYQNFYSR
jgi:hypothetical protein